METDNWAIFDNYKLKKASGLNASDKNILAL